MGLCASGPDPYVSSLFQIYRFRVPDKPSSLPTFLPGVNYFTGDIDAHDMAFEESGDSGRWFSPPRSSTASLP